MIIEPEQSEEFVKLLEENGFSLEDWEYLETLLQYEGLSDAQMQDLETLRKTIATVSKKYAVG